MKTQFLILAALVGYVSCQGNDLLGNLGRQASQLPVLGNLLPGSQQQGQQGDLLGNLGQQASQLPVLGNLLPGNQQQGGLLSNLRQQANQLPVLGNLMPGNQQQGQQGGLLPGLPNLSNLLNGGRNNGAGLLNGSRAMVGNLLNSASRQLGPNGQLQSAVRQVGELPLGAMSGISGGLSQLANRISNNQGNPMLQGLPNVSDLTDSLSGRNGLLQNVLPGGQNTQGGPLDGAMKQASELGQRFSPSSMAQQAAHGAGQAAMNSVTQ